MSYSDFTIDIVRREFGIALRDQALFEPVGDLVPSPWLRESLQIGMSLPILSEKARSEFIVAPILADCRERLERRIDIFSGARLDVDPERGLKGECDFVLTRRGSKFALQAPLMLIVEAKKHDIEEAIGQCAAEMLGACRYNERDGKLVPHLYGCITNAETWLFLKLEQNVLQIHPERIAMSELSRILWLLVECLKDVEQQASEAA